MKISRMAGRNPFEMPREFNAAVTSFIVKNKLL
jgi:hypothetical protein